MFLLRVFTGLLWTKHGHQSSRMQEQKACNAARLADKKPLATGITTQFREGRRGQPPSISALRPRSTTVEEPVSNERYRVGETGERCHEGFTVKDMMIIYQQSVLSCIRFFNVYCCCYTSVCFASQISIMIILKMSTMMSTNGKKDKHSIVQLYLIIYCM